jgi:hypothetical protein
MLPAPISMTFRPAQIPPMAPLRENVTTV